MGLFAATGTGRCHQLHTQQSPQLYLRKEMFIGSIHAPLINILQDIRKAVSCMHNLKNCIGKQMKGSRKFQPILMLPTTEKCKVMLSLNNSQRIRKGIKCRASILTLTFGTTRRAEMSALHTGLTLPPGKFLGAQFYEGWNFNFGNTLLDWIQQLE